MATFDDLAAFEMPHTFIEPALKLCRSMNTCLDFAFYDVPAFAGYLRAHGEVFSTRDRANAPATIDLSAVDNPEGALLVVDAHHQPAVLRFETVPDFLKWHATADDAPRFASITGVGSSALGSAALAWDISSAVKAKVLAIVPGYGLADCILQGMGGWFGFGLHNALNSKSIIQDVLARTVPDAAWIGRALSASVPGSKRAPSGAPVFETGCGSSDVLHALLREIGLACVIGHSKGALAIENALRSIAVKHVEGLQVVTLGCPIAEEIPEAKYHQFLGLCDALGQANAWGNLPDTWIWSGHSTNAQMPLSMQVAELIADGPAAAVARDKAAI